MSVAGNGSTQQHGASRTAAPVGPARIVLVGQTGLDGVLATPATTELVRVRSGTDALGEVSSWRHRQGERDVQQVVVLGDAIDTDPTLMRAAKLAHALRQLDPHVRVLAVGRPLEQSFDADAADDAFDGWLDMDDPVYASQMLLRPDQRPVADRLPHAGEVRGSAPRPAEVVAPEPPPPPADDGDLVQRLHDRKPIVDAAIDIASRRLGVPLTLEKGQHDRGGAGRAPLPGMPDLVLVGPRATGEALEGAAIWLARWIALEEEHARLVAQATTDPLTGACNRRAFDEMLLKAIDHAGQARRDVSVLVFDIDNFKQYNDRHGHEAGDEILCEVVRLLESVIRPTDKVCRIGGDEFAVIFDDPAGPREPSSRHPSSVVDLARRFQRQVASKRFPKLGEDAPGRLTVSGGLATFPWDGLDGASLVRVADQRALECKRQGKNAIELGPNAG
ncbi:MAG: GGDEF domain-containing protein [Phycisphaerales bacterium]